MGDVTQSYTAREWEIYRAGQRDEAERVIEPHRREVSRAYDMGYDRGYVVGWKHAKEEDHPPEVPAELPDTRPLDFPERQWAAVAPPLDPRSGRNAAMLESHKRGMRGAEDD
jgi:hypothetical protein